MANDTPVGKILRAPKYTLVEGDPLINVLKPELVNIIPRNTLAAKFKESVLPPEEDEDDDDDDKDKDKEINLKVAPNLSDITIVKKEKIRDGNKNDLVRFTINVKNHVGDSVVGARVYGI
jgi:hypothetical protein